MGLCSRSTRSIIMGFINQTTQDKEQAADTIKIWYNDAITSFNNFWYQLDALQTQLDLMKTNSDYTTDDIQEVEELITNLKTKTI